MPAEDVETVRAIYDHWSRGDWRYGADLFAEDGTFTTFDASGEEIVCHGREAFQRWFREFLEQWEDLRQDADELIECESGRILAIGRQSAAGRASGVRLGMPIFNVWTFRDGKVVEFFTTRHESTARHVAGAARPDQT